MGKVYARLYHILRGRLGRYTIAVFLPKWLHRANVILLHPGRVLNKLKRITYKLSKLIQFGHRITRAKVLVEDFGISFVECDEDEKILAVHCDISAADIDTEEKVREWLPKLSKKLWITPELLTDYIASCNRLFPMLNFESK